MRASLLLLAIFALGGPCLADDGDWRDARPDDFKDTPSAAARAAVPNQALSVSGDFDGDGRADAARLMVSVKAGVYAVVVEFARPAGPARLLVAAAPLADLGAVGLDAERHGRRADLVIFTFDGARQVVRFERGRLAVRWPGS